MFEPNFKLAVISALMLAQPELFPPENVLIPRVLQRPYDMEREGYEPIPEMRKYFEAYPLGEEQLDRVTTVVLDGGSPVYFYIWSFWGGEDDYFEVHSLEGIERCRNLRELHVNALAASLDLSPLRGMKRLEEVTLDLVPHTGLEVLLTLPSLRRVTFFATEHFETSPVPAELEKRGVAVRWY